MSVAKVIEITSTSAKSFEDAIEKGDRQGRQDAQERRGRVDQGAESHRYGRQSICCRSHKDWSRICSDRLRVGAVLMSALGQKQTSPSSFVMSARCQKEKSAPSLDHCAAAGRLLRASAQPFRP